MLIKGIEINEDDLCIEESLSGYGFVNIYSVEVRHLPTGLSAMSMSERSQLANMVKDLQELAALLKEQQPKKETKKHPHAELMLEYAQDALTMSIEEVNKNWELRTDKSDWKTIESCKGAAVPAWNEDVQYRRKPKTIRVGNYDVPEPLREAPLKGTTVYVVSLLDLNLSEHIVIQYQWQNIEVLKLALKRRLLHANKEAAELHAKALLSFTTTEFPSETNK